MLYGNLQAMMDTNYLGSVFTSRAVIKKMKERKKGHVVYVSSIGGQVKCAISASKTTVIITRSNQRLGSAFCRIYGVIIENWVV